MDSARFLYFHHNATGSCLKLKIIEEFCLDRSTIVLGIPLDIAETASNSQELTDKDLESMTVYSLSQTYMNAWKDQPKEWSLSILFEVQANNVNTPYSLR